MSERLPKLSIYRPVQADGTEWAHAMLPHLLESGEHNVKDIQQSMWAMTELKADIFMPLETESLLKRFSKYRPDADSEGVIECVKGAMPNSSLEPIENVPLMPFRSHRDGRKANRKALTVGHHPAVSNERQLAKSALRNYFALNKMPSYIWLKDEYVTGIRIARSRKDSEASVVLEMARLLNAKKILPEVVTLGPVAYEIN